MGISHRLALALLVLLYLAVAVAHDTLAPLTTGPDELAHYEYVNFIANYGRLPQNNAERGEASYKSDQPPLYHWLAALPASLVDPTGPPSLKRVTDHPRRQLIERTRHAWGLYNTEDERWPYQGEVLRWHVGRWVAILFGAATVVMTFVVARAALADARLALAAAAVVAFIPRYALTGSMLNYETTLAFFSALFLWMLLRISQSPNLPISRTFLLGLFGGLAIVTKLSAVIFVPEIVVAFWLIGRAAGLPWRKWLARLVAAGLGMAIPVGAWYGFVVARFNTIATDGLWVGLLRPLIAADSSDATTNRLLSLLTGGQAGFTAAIENLDSGPPWEWLAIFFRTFWVVGIEQHQPLGWGGLLIALSLLILAAYGLFTYRLPSTIYRLPSTVYRLPSTVYRLLLLHLAAAFVLPLVRYAVTFSLADTAQGRHVLFQTAPAFAILLIAGLVVAAQQISHPKSPTPIPHPTSHIPNLTSHISHPNYQVMIAFVPALFLFLWTGVQLYTMTWAYHPLLPVSTRPVAETQAQTRLDYAFNDAVTLAGYTAHPVDDQTLRLDLLWRAEAISPVDYLTEVTLTDGQGNLQTQWLGYPAEGRYPTRAWDVGDIVRDTVWLPVSGLPGGTYHIHVDLIPPQPQPPAPATEAITSMAAPPLQLEPVSIPAQPAQTADFQIWQAGRPLAAAELFRYRETVMVTLSAALAGVERQVQIVGPGQHYPPTRDLGRVVLFTVGPEWSSGDYRLQITPAGAAPLVSEPLIQVIDRWQRQFDPPPVSRPLNANFAGQIELLGYNLEANRAEPGGGVPITLVWQGLTWPAGDYTIFARLIKQDDLTVHGGRDRLPREWYRTIYWVPGEVVTDPFGVPVDADAPDGIYHLSLGLYREVNGQAVNLPLVQDGQPIDAASVEIGPLKVGRTPPQFLTTGAQPQVQVNQIFGDPPALTLLGYDLADDTGRLLSKSPNPQSPISNLHLTLYWQVESTLPIDYTTFVHLRNASGETVAQKDRPPLDGAYPTSLWEPGEVIADEITVPLPENLPPGPYHLVVGMYDFTTWARLSVPGQANGELELTEVTLKP